MTITFSGEPEELMRLLSSAIKPQLDEIHNRLDQLLLSENAMKINVQALLDAVNQETTVDNSILALVDQLVVNLKDISKQLADAIAASDPTALQAVQDAIDASAATMQANATAIKTSVTNNTPASGGGSPIVPPPPPPPPAPTA